MEHVLVLMSTYNGEKYLSQQIESILNQQEVDVSILVRDDGSTDKTIDILKEYSQKSNMKWIKGNNVGPAYSFMELLRVAPEEHYISFADQDDVWKPDKLLTAVNSLMNISEPAFYNSLVEVVDESLNFNGQIYGTTKKYNFGTQVARSSVIGCTMVINQPLIKILKQHNPTNVVMHDQWIAIVCKGLDGTEIKDNEPHMFYRQHSDNVIGSEKSIFKRLKKSSLANRNPIRRCQAKEIYDTYKDSFSTSNKKELFRIITYKEDFFSRMSCIFGYYNTESFIYNLLIRFSFLRGTF